MYFRERVARAGSVVFLLGMVAVQGVWFFPGAGASGLARLRWFLLLVLLLTFLAAYLTRTAAKSLANTPAEVFLPLVCAALPLLTTHGAFGPAEAPLAPGFPAAGAAVMAAGDSIAIAAMLTLRRSFSLLVEARGHETTGLYRFARHPLYAGEILVLLGWCLYRPSPWVLAGTAVFAVLQSARARLEERKLSAVHAGYAAYKARTGMFFPL